MPLGHLGLGEKQCELEFSEHDVTAAPSPSARAKTLTPTRRSSFGGESRPMRDVALAIAEAEIEDDLPIVEVEEWQVL